jgi:group II intron reverse transcriptase/maturase
MSNKKSVGLDGVSKQEYGINLERNVRSLLERIKNGSYHPRPLKRVYVPKHGNKKRPLGIICYEDKLVASNVTKLLSAIYEPKFLRCSYGFRQNRNCHDAILTLRKIIMNKTTNYIVESDIKSFFDTIDHRWLIRFLRHDIADDRFIRLVSRFINVGIVERGRYTNKHRGTPQGNTISSILANVYLHYVVDLWFEKIVKRECCGSTSIVRYADDFVCAFECTEDAEAFLMKLEHRLKKFNLQMAEEKTKLLRVDRHCSFSFLGFTFLCNGTSVALHTDENMLSEKIENIKMLVSDNKDLPPHKLISRLNSVLVGHYNYYGFSTNMSAMTRFKRITEAILLRELRARGVSNPRLYLSRLIAPRIRIQISDLPP